MATIQPDAGDKMNNPSHSFLHRVIASDAVAPEQSFVVDASGNVSIKENKKYQINGNNLSTSDLVISDDHQYVTDSEKLVLQHTSGVNTGDMSDLDVKTAYEANADTNAYTDANKTKLEGIEMGAEVNNISDVNAVDLTDSGNSSLHYHSTDRARANHTGTQLASTISDFDTEVANNSAVTANTAKITNATHTGEVTGDEALTIANNVVDEANLKLDETPTNGYVLTADDSKSGGMKWAEASGGMSSGIYDPAGVTEQLVGLTAIQTLTNKTFTSPKINENVILNATSTELNLLSGLTVLSGENTGDQDLSGLALKSNVLELDNTDAFTPDADYEPATKKYVDDNAGGSPEGTAIKSTGETGAVKFLREDGDGTCSWQVPAGGGDVSKSGTPEINDFARFVSETSIEGRSFSEVKVDLDLDNVNNTSDDTKNSAVATLTNKTLTSPKINEDVELISTSTELNLLSGITTLSGSNTGDQDLSAYATKTGTETLTNKTLTSPVINNPSGITKADVGLGNVVNLDTSNASNITSGILPSSVLPPVALTSVQVVASETAMLALTTEKGDVVVRSDENKSYMHNGGTTGTMADFTELQTPTDSVLSVNGKTGTVALTQDDIGNGTTYVQTENNFTDAEKTIVGNTSGVNTGDQDLSGLALKSNVLELDNTDAFTPDTDYEPATKKYVDDNTGGGADIALSNLSNVQISTDLVFTDDSSVTDRTIKIDDQVVAATNGNNFIVKAGKGNTTGSGGQVKITGGVAGEDGGAGGDVFISGGDINEYGNGINPGGDSGNVYINSGNIFAGYGQLGKVYLGMYKNVYIKNLDGYSAVLDSTLLDTGDKNFQFPNNDGILALTSDIPVGATGTEIDTGTNDIKYATAKAMADSEYFKSNEDVTLTNKRITPRVGSTTSSATPTINTDNYDIYRLTAQAEDITSFTTNLSGTPNHGDSLIIEITGTAARTITWGSSFEASTVALPTTTVGTDMLTIGFKYNSATSKWRCMAQG